MKEEKNNEVLVDREYIKNCLVLDPAGRLKELESLNNFIFGAMPKESKRSWEKLKKAGF